MIKLTTLFGASMHTFTQKQTMVMAFGSFQVNQHPNKLIATGYRLASPDHLRIEAARKNIFTGIGETEYLTDITTPGALLHSFKSAIFKIRNTLEAALRSGNNLPNEIELVIYTANPNIFKTFGFINTAMSNHRGSKALFMPKSMRECLPVNVKANRDIVEDTLDVIEEITSVIPNGLNINRKLLSSKHKPNNEDETIQRFFCNRVREEIQSELTHYIGVENLKQSTLDNIDWYNTQKIVKFKR